MQDKPVCLSVVDTVENIRDALTSNNHHAFPLINDEYRLVGMIPRNYVLIIVKN